VLGSAYRLRGFPPGLFGIWVLSEGPEWNGDYHLNYNHNAPTYGLFSANRIEQADVATDPYLDFLPRARRYSKEICNTGGILFPVGIGPKGIDATYNTAAVDARYGNSKRSAQNVLLHGQKSNASESLTPVNLRFRSTWDPEYAKKYYPFVADAAAFRNATRPGNGHAIARTTEVGGDLLGPERRGEAGWDISVALEDLIDRYHAFIDPDIDPYGYRNTGCSISTFANTPDNTIPIVHHTTEHGRWAPLFPRVYRN
jgi:hypothetical protein